MGLSVLWGSASRAVLPMMTTKSRAAYGGLGWTVAVRTPMMTIISVPHGRRPRSSINTLICQ